MFNRNPQSEPHDASDAQEINFYGAALVDDEGVEIPITEEMVEQALSHPQGSVGSAGDGEL
ncbi:PA1571 family protein [Pseudomaricurvus sp.]|uniref:PA1571 family protein n=1 Tax=Pseudomaricurvus sp. TaxID=2004510 RepID=UPI003F6AA3E1